MKSYKRNCPQCGKEISYKNKYNLANANTNNSVCATCINVNRHRNNPTDYFKQCPICKKNMYYTTNNSLNRAIANNSKCTSCNNKIRKIEYKYKRNCPQCGKELLYSSDKGFNNANFNDTVCFGCSAKNLYYNKTTTEFFRNCPTCNKIIYYSSKRGRDMGESLQNECKSCAAKTVYHNRVKNGQPVLNFNGSKFVSKSTIPPKRGGRGWSGYFKGHHFRSLLELDYIIYLINNNVKFISAENKQDAIKYYLPDNSEHRYYLDFYLIDSDQFVEIKPKDLMHISINKIKFKAAKEKLGDKYIVITDEEIEKVDIQTLEKYCLNGDLIFDKAYIDKFNKYCIKGRRK